MTELAHGEVYDSLKVLGKFCKRYRVGCVCGWAKDRYSARALMRANGIVGVVLHDMRRHCFSGMFEQGFSVPEVQKLSLHRNPTILLKNYTALTPESLHLGPAAKRLAA